VSLRAIIYECVEKCSDKERYAGGATYVKFYPACFQDCVGELVEKYGVGTGGRG